MSFDSEFDYTPVVNGLGEEKSVASSTLAVLSSELSTLQSAKAYLTEPLVQARISDINRNISGLTLTISTIDSVLNEIAAVQSLSVENKEALLFFYVTVGTVKQDFMSRLLFNYEAALTDQRIAALRADTVTPGPAKTLIAKLYYENYPINQENARVIVSIFRYVR